MLNLAQISKAMESLKEWGLEGNTIVKDSEFPSFRSAAEFVGKIGELSEKHNHSPTILIENRTVKLILTTKEERGLTEKDFSLAEAIDNIGKTEETNIKENNQEIHKTEKKINEKLKEDL